MCVRCFNIWFYFSLSYSDLIDNKLNRWFFFPPKLSLFCQWWWLVSDLPHPYLVIEWLWWALSTQPRSTHFSWLILLGWEIEFDSEFEVWLCFWSPVPLITHTLKNKIIGCLQITYKAPNISMRTFQVYKVNEQIKYSWWIVHEYSHKYSQTN